MVLIYGKDSAHDTEGCGYFPCKMFCFTFSMCNKICNFKRQSKTHTNYPCRHMAIRPQCAVAPLIRQCKICLLPSSDHINTKSGILRFSFIPWLCGLGMKGMKLTENRLNLPYILLLSSSACLWPSK